MFNFKDLNIEKSDLAIVSSSFRTLLYDDIPILYTGSNFLGNLIIGSFIDEDIENNINYYFHTIINKATYYDFINNKITYRSILLNNFPTYVVKHNYLEEIFIAYNLQEKSIIPEDYLPAIDSYCPTIDFIPDSKYTIDLSGKYGDYAKADSNDVNLITYNFKDIIEKISKSINGLEIHPTLYMYAPTSNSFDLNYLLEFSQQDMFFDEKLLLNYINNFLKGTVNINSINNLDDLKHSSEFNEIKFSAEKLYNNSSINIPLDIDALILSNLYYTYEKVDNLTKNLGINYTDLYIYNDVNPIAQINSEIKNNINLNVEILETSLYEVREDLNPKDYKIQIYSLNVNSRKGSAILVLNDNEANFINKPKIFITGTENLSNTKFTESLYKDIIITVKAKAKIIDSKYKFLNIEYE